MHSFIRASASLLIAASALLVPPTRNPVVRETRVGSDIIISIKHSLPWPRSPHAAHTQPAPRRQAISSGALGALVTTVAAVVTAAAPMRKAAQKGLECHRVWSPAGRMMHVDQ